MDNPNNTTKLPFEQTPDYIVEDKEHTRRRDMLVLHLTTSSDRDGLTIANFAKNYADELEHHLKELANLRQRYERGDL